MENARKKQKTKLSSIDPPQCFVEYPDEKNKDEIKDLLKEIKHLNKLSSDELNVFVKECRQIRTTYDFFKEFENQLTRNYGEIMSRITSIDRRIEVLEKNLLKSPSENISEANNGGEIVESNDKL